ncbi:hypothetical protein [Bradyrhizobium sp.]|jgi:branched-chain amino acid transport system ATP-binding protein|uniref:hypothetical protein n=1 Tax=Nitrobacteraceae TaxID=41294 RepID=UPI000AC68576|nr:hypothetical protein [Bradyrhizobium sp.]
MAYAQPVHAPARNSALQDKKLLELAECIATEPRCILLDKVMAGLTMAETAAPIAIIKN